MARKDAILKLRETLVRRRNSLRRSLAGDLSLLQEMHHSKTGDLLDAAADSVQDELNSQLLEVESRELTSIDDAIEKIDSGVYGVCESCEKPIPLARLRAIPYATECIACRREAEKRSESAVAFSWARTFEDVNAETN